MYNGITHQWSRNCPVNNRTSMYASSSKRDVPRQQNGCKRGYWCLCLGNIYRKPGKHIRWSSLEIPNTVFQNRSLNTGGWLCLDRDTIWAFYYALIMILAVPVWFQTLKDLEINLGLIQVGCCRINRKLPACGSSFCLFLGGSSFLYILMFLGTFFGLLTALNL